jgi:hypothetical protein
VFANTACSGHFLRFNTPFSNRQLAIKAIQVRLPDNSFIQSTHTCNIDISGLLPTATKAHIFKTFAHVLLSIPVLADHGCTMSFTKDAVIVTLQDNIILQGYRNHAMGMWTVPLVPNPHSTPLANHAIQPTHESPLFQAANSAYHMKNKKELAMFYHAAAGYPIPSTWIKAIQAGNYTTWPALTADLISRNLPASIIMAKGHMQQQ